MLQISEKINHKGKRQVTVVLDEGERLMSIHPDQYYRLGYPADDIMQGHIISEAAQVMWCSIEQRWID